MRAKVGWGLVWGAVLITFWTVPTRRAAAGNCALYARAQTGVDLYGAAGGWWSEAAARYWRGHVPQVGSILVFKRTGYIPSGHVAVVARVISAREIIVNQANWYRGMVTPYVPVVDESPDNDWTDVSVMDLGTGKYGRDNPSFGFVYPQTGPREIVARTDTVGFNPSITADRTAYQPGQPDELFHFAGTAAADERRRNVRHKTATRGSRRKRAVAHAPHLAAAVHVRRRAEGHAHSFAHVHPASYAHHEPVPVHAALAQPHPDGAPSRRAGQKPRHRA